MHLVSIVSPLIAAAAMMLYGCRTNPDSASQPNQMTNGGSTRMPPPIQSPRPTPGGEPVRTVIDARPAALVNGQAVSTGDLRPILNELAGAEALQEVILDRRIEEALAAAGLAIQPDDVAAERKLLLESLSHDDVAALRMLDEMRVRAKLGKVRFERLMRRNASLRALVQKDLKAVPGETSMQRAEREGPLMNQLSQRLLSGVAVTVYDESLAESWAHRKERP
jgi:hypothetical protein